MKRLLLISLLLLTSLVIASCGNTQAPLTEVEQAAKYNMSVEEFQENKVAAARMNMTIEEHLNMGHDASSWMDDKKMPMPNDSDLIEDDMEK